MEKCVVRRETGTGPRRKTFKFSEPPFARCEVCSKTGEACDGGQPCALCVSRLSQCRYYSIPSSAENKLSPGHVANKLWTYPDWSREAIRLRVPELKFTLFHGVDTQLSLWFNEEQVHHLLSVYTVTYHTHFPLMHFPSFKVETCDIHLLAALVMMGTVWEPTCTLRETREMMELLYAPAEMAMVSSEEVSLQSAQCMFLLIVMYAWHGSSQQRSNAPAKFATLSGVLRKAGFLLEQPTPTTWRWQEWADQESRARVTLHYLMLDASMVIFFNIPPNFGSLEIRVDMPCDDEAWESDNPAEVQKLVSSRPRLSFPNALQMLLSPDLEFPADCCNEFGRGVLIHAIHNHIWTAQHYLLPQQPKSASEDFVDVMSNALEKWRGAFQEQSTVRDGGRHQRAGFCRDGEPYFWLAKLFLAKDRQTEWDQAHGELDTAAKVHKQLIYIQNFLRQQGGTPEAAGERNRFSEEYGLSEDKCDLSLLLVVQRKDVKWY